MLFGNRHQLAIEVAQLAPTWERRYPPERTGWASFGLWAHGRNLCRHVIEGSDRVREGVNIPLAPLAHWFVKAWPFLEFEERASDFTTSEDLYGSLARWGDSQPSAGMTRDEWDDVREAWWARHFLAAGADGAYMPSVGLARQDELLVIQWRARLCGAEGTRVLFSDGQATVPWDAARDCISEFVAFVADWLRQDGEENLYPWVAHKDPLAASQASLLRALELYTGRTAASLRRLTDTQTDDGLAERLGLPVGGLDPAESPVTQALRDLPPQLPPHAAALLRTLDAETRREAPADDRVRSLRDLARDAMRGAETPEQAGYTSASALRRSLGLDGEPVGNARQLLLDLGIQARFEDLRLPLTRMLAGSREGRVPVVEILLSDRTQSAWGQRFECARGLGHLLLDPSRGGAVGAASSAFAEGLRRRRSGAFAAELLLPERAVARLTGGVLDAVAEPGIFAALLERFGVGARAAAYHLWNRGFISSESIRDELIEEFAAPTRP